MTFDLITLGCKVNFYESNALREMFLSERFTESKNNPDVVVINTCSVTSVADQKSRQYIRRAKRNNPHCVVAVMGCYSQKNADYVIKECNADIVVGTSNRNKIIDFVNQFIMTKKPIIMVDNDTRHLKYESFGVFTIPESTRAYIKVEDGCNNFCSYCTIPYTRGNARSRDKGEIIAEISHLIAQGFKEFVLAGIHTAHYGLDLKGVTFSDLVEEIANLPGLYRLRISSIEESEIDEKFISLLKKYDCIADHLHMPLQSGSQSVLKRMRRKYNVDDFVDKVQRIREVRPNIAITTDVIVGFPGESDTEFLETVEFVKKVNFTELHVFPFSAREGTVAYSLPDQIDPKIKAQRVETLIELSNKLQSEYKNKFLNQELEVILEERNQKTGLLSGFTSNYLKLSVDLPDEMIGKIYKIKVS